MSKENFKIAENIVNSFEARVQVVQAIADDTQKLLLNFRNQRERMSQELKEALSQRESLRKKDFDKMMADILTVQSMRERNITKVLVDFQEQEMKVLNNLKAMLEKGEKLRLRDFKKTLVKIREGQEARQKETPLRIDQEMNQMRQEVQDMLENFKKERQGASAEWANLLALITEKRKLMASPVRVESYDEKNGQM